MSANPFGFWRWFFWGDGGTPGLKKFVDRWLLLHVLAGWLLGRFVNAPLVETARTVLLPLTGVLVGLSFAWVGNAQALLQSAEIEAIADHSRGGIKGFVYTFQTAVLTLLVVIVLWGLAAVGLVDVVWPAKSANGAPKVAVGILFGLTSLGVRECWQVVMASQWLLLMRHGVRQVQRNKKGEDSDE